MHICNFNSIVITRLASFFLIILLVSSCSTNNDDDNKELKKQILLTDSLLAASKLDSTALMLKKLRPQIKDNDPLIATYYRLESTFHADHIDEMNLYADSALSFFNSNTRIKKYADEYLKALIAKADVGMKAKKYITALSYYYKAKNELSNGNCDDGLLDSKMAIIYYSQKKFKLAAKCWIGSYQKAGICHVKYTNENLFYLKQGALNNAGFSYDKAEMLDSALYYYMKDLSLIENADRSGVINKHNINVAYAVVYDNLGGINLKQGNLQVALDYLTKCMALTIKDIDGLRIPPLLKLVQIYLKKGDRKNTEDAFDRSKVLLDKFGQQNPESDLLWNKLYAEYLLSLNQPAKAYYYQRRYIAKKDSVTNSLMAISQLDVDRELSTIRQQQTFDELQREDNAKKIYLAGVSVIVILTIIIMIMIIGNLKKTQKNHKNATIHNQQLQFTLAELERVNKNYIRIMRVMAHDLRNPLSGMTGLATMLLDEEEFSEENKHMLKLIETTGIHSMEMINELLKTGLADENEKVLTQRLDLRSLLYDSVELLQFKAKDKQQQIAFNSNDEPVMADVNHEKIWRVFNNLIVNAIKFSHEGGAIEVAIKTIKDHTLISVADNGIGIPASEKDSVFEMFTPAKKVGTDGEQPFGLGLSISKKIVEKHNGKIWFENNPSGTGTIFYIELPLSK